MPPLLPDSIHSFHNADCLVQWHDLGFCFAGLNAVHNLQRFPFVTVITIHAGYGSLLDPFLPDKGSSYLVYTKAM